MEEINCNYCGSASSRIIFQPADWLLNRLDVKTSLVQCSNCGLIYQNPRPTTAEIGQHYPSEYEPYHSHEKKEESWLMRKAVEYGMEKRAHAVTAHKTGGTLLDLGCASGDFLSHMQRKPGWQVEGVEISEYAADWARKKYGLHVFCGTLEQAGFADNTFDAVTMWDVLEHLHDPSRTLGELHRILKPGGILALRVPNADSLDARVFGPYWSGLDSPRHLYVFGEKAISNLLKKNGFEVISLSSRQGSYLGFALSLRFMLTAKNVRPSTREAITRFMYHPVMRLLTAPLFYLYGLVCKTTQMMVISRVEK